MNLSKPFIIRPVFTTLVMVSLVVFGILSFKTLPVASIPAMEYPTILVTTNYPGASPELMATLISAPLERQFMLMQGIQFAASTNTYETSQIVLTFHLDVDINIAAQETEQAIQMALAQLPKNLPQNPTYTKFNPSDTPILYLVAYSPSVSPWTLYDYGYSFLGQQLGTVEGISEIQTYGFPYAVRVQVNPQALAAMNVSLEEVSKAIDSGNPQQPTGKFYNKISSIGINTNGQLPQAKDYENVIVKYQDGSPVYLKDVAIITDNLQNNKQQFFWSTKDYPEGVPLVFLSLYRQLGYNTVEACTKVEALIDRLAPQIPGGIMIDIPFTLSKWILEAVADVEFTLIVAFLLVVLVVYVYLGRARNSIIPLISLPITILSTFIIMRLFDYSLDIMSLSALTLSIGFLIDDAIVVLENIVRFAETEKLTPFQAAIKGSKQIVMVVVAISLCLSVVFVPMLFLQGAVGQIFHEFAAVIIIAVLFSGFISLSLTPMLSSRFLAHYDDGNLTKMEKFSAWLNDLMISTYKPMLSFAIKHKFMVLMLSSLSIIFSIILFAVMPQEFLPPDDLGAIQAFVSAKEGTSPEKMREYMKKLQLIAIQNPAVRTSAAISGNPTDAQSLFFMNLLDRSERKDIWSVMKELDKAFAAVDDVVVIQKSFPLINLQIGGAESGKAQNQFLLQSFDQKTLYDTAEKLLEALSTSSSLKNVGSDFRPNSPTLNIDLLRPQSHSFGNITASQIESALMYAYGETYISKINVPQNMYYVILEVEDKFLSGPGSTSSLYLANNNKTPNDQVAIDSVITKKMSTSPEMINHVNALTSVTISFDPAEGVALSDAIAVVQKIANDTVPETVVHQLVGNTASFQQTIKQFLKLVILSIFVIYIILGILYENFLSPITALSAIPVALLGGLLTLLVCGEIISIYALIGLIMLLGIVMKNGILIIDFALEIMEEKKVSATEAAFEACVLRFRPILMTTIAAMMGALPIALGIGGTIAEGRAPLGIAVVGGLIFAQAVTLFLTPVVFIYIQQLHTHFTTHYHLFKPKEE